MRVKWREVKGERYGGKRYGAKTNGTEPVRCQGKWCRKVEPNRVVKKIEAVGFFVRAFTLAR